MSPLSIHFPGSSIWRWTREIRPLYVSVFDTYIRKGVLNQTASQRVPIGSRGLETTVLILSYMYEFTTALRADIIFFIGNRFIILRSDCHILQYRCKYGSYGNLGWISFDFRVTPETHSYKCLFLWIFFLIWALNFKKRGWTEEEVGTSYMQWLLLYYVLVNWDVAENYSEKNLSATN